MVLARLPDNTETVKSTGMSTMTDSPEIETGDTTITVLSVSPTQDDHDVLERLLTRRRSWQLWAGPRISSGCCFSP